MPKDTISRSDYLKIMYGQLDNEVASLSNNINKLGNETTDQLQVKALQQSNNIQNTIDTASKATNGESHQSDASWWDRTTNTAGSLVSQIGEGFLGFFDGIGDLGIDIAHAFGWISDEQAEGSKNYDWQAQTLRGVGSAFNFIGGDANAFNGDWSAEGSREYLQNELYDDSWLTQADDGVVNFVRGLEQNFGNMIPSIMTGKFAGSEAVSLATMAVGAFSRKTSDTLAENGGDWGKALASGALDATIETVSEIYVGKWLGKLGIGNGKIFGIIGKGGKAISKTAKYTARDFLKTIGQSFVEEGAEEVFSKLLSPIVDSINEGTDAFKKWGTSDFWVGQDDSVLMNFLSGGVLGALGTGGSEIRGLSRYGKTGYALMLQEQSRREALDNASKEQDPVKREKYLEQVGEAIVKERALLENAKENGETKRMQNTISDMLNPTKAMGDNFVDSLNNIEKKLKTTENAVNSKDINKVRQTNIAEKLMPEIRGLYSTEPSIEFVDGLKENAEFEISNGKPTLKINSKLTNNLTPVFVHEALIHTYQSNLSEKQINAEASKVKKTNWFKENGKKLRENYTEKLNSLGKKMTETYFNKELVANYFESMLSSEDTLKAYNTAEDIVLRQSIWNKVKGKFKAKSMGIKSFDYRTMRAIADSALKLSKRLNNAESKALRKLRKAQNDFWKLSEDERNTIKKLLGNKIEQPAYSLSNDINYSIKDRADTDGNDINPNMNKYMGFSKATKDEKLGEPLVVAYHGSPVSHQEESKNKIAEQKTDNGFVDALKNVAALKKKAVAKQGTAEFKEAYKEYQSAYEALPWNYPNEYKQYKLNLEKKKAKLENVLDKADAEKENKLSINTKPVSSKPVAETKTEIKVEPKVEKKPIEKPKTELLNTKPVKEEPKKAEIKETPKAEEKKEEDKPKAETKKAETKTENGFDMAKIEELRSKPRDEKGDYKGKVYVTNAELKLLREYANYVRKAHQDAINNADKLLDELHHAQAEFYHFRSNENKQAFDLAQKAYDDAVAEKNRLLKEVRKSSTKRYVTSPIGRPKGEKKESFYKAKEQSVNDAERAKILKNREDAKQRDIKALEIIIEQANLAKVDKNTAKFKFKGKEFTVAELERKLGIFKKQKEKTQKKEAQLKSSAKYNEEKAKKITETNRANQMGDKKTSEYEKKENLAIEKAEKKAAKAKAFEEGKTPISKMDKTELQKKAYLQKDEIIKQRAAKSILTKKVNKITKEINKLKEQNATLQADKLSLEEKLGKGETLVETKVKFTKRSQAPLREDFKPSKTPISETKQSANEKLGKVHNKVDFDRYLAKLEKGINEIVGEKYRIADLETKAKRFFEDYTNAPLANKKAVFVKFFEDAFFGKQTTNKTDKTAYERIRQTLYDIEMEDTKANTERAYKISEQKAQEAMDKISNEAWLAFQSKGRDSDMDKVFKSYKKLVAETISLRNSNRIWKTLNGISKQLSRGSMKEGTGQIKDASGPKQAVLKFVNSLMAYTKYDRISNSNVGKFVDNFAETDENGNVVSIDKFSKMLDSLTPKVEKVGDIYEVKDSDFSEMEQGEIENMLLAKELIKGQALALAQSYVKGKMLDNTQLGLMRNVVIGVYEIYKIYSNEALKAAKAKAEPIIKLAKDIGKSRKGNKITAKGMEWLMNYASPDVYMAYIFGGTQNNGYKTLWEDLIKKPYYNKVQDMNTYLDRVMEIGKKGIQRTRFKDYKAVDMDGRKVKLKRYEIYQYYLNTLSQDNYLRIKNNGFVTHTEDITHKISVAEMDNAVLKLAKEEKEELALLFKFYNDKQVIKNDKGEVIFKGMSKYAEDTMTKNLGFARERENYYPILTNRSSVSTDLTQDPNAPFGNMSYSAIMNNHFKALSNNRSIIEINHDPFSVARSYINQITTSNQQGESSRDFSRLMRVKVNGESLKMVASNYSNDASGFISYIYNQSLGNTKSLSNGAKTTRKLLGRYSTAVLGANIRSMLKQFGSFVTAWQKVGFWNGLKSLFQPITRKLRENAKANAIFQARIRDNEFVNSVTLGNGIGWNAKTAVDKLLTILTKPLELTDRLVCYATYNMCENYADSLGLKGEERTVVINDMFTDVLNETQSNNVPIYMSRVRSGNKGEFTRALFGMFQSDAQNKASLLMREAMTLNEAKKNSNYEQLAKSRKAMATWAAGVVLSGIITLLADRLADLITNKKDPEDLFKAEDEYGSPLWYEMLSNTVIDWLPYVNTIAGWFEYGEVGYMPTENLNTLVSDLSSLAKNGFTQSNLMTIGQDLAMFFGIPAKNIMNLIDGIGRFDPEYAVKKKSLFGGLTSEWLSAQLSNDIKKGKTKSAVADISTLFSLYKAPISDETASELVNLKANGIEYSVHSVPKDLDGDKLNTFKSAYNQLGTAMDNMIKSSAYKNLDNASKGKVITKLSNAYYELAMALVKGETPTNKLAVILSTGADITPLLAYACSIDGSLKKEEALKIINKLKGTSKGDKMLIAWIAGYSASGSSKQMLISRFVQMGIKRSIAEQLA